MSVQQVRIESALVDETGHHIVVNAQLPNGQVIRDTVAPINFDRVQLATWLVEHAARLRAMSPLTGIVEIDSQEYDRADAAHREALHAAAAAPAPEAPEATPDPTSAPAASEASASVDPAADAANAKKAAK